MLKQLLESKGFVENLDFTLVGEELTALERTRDVEQIIHHEEVPAVMDGEVEVTPAVPAYDEVVIVQETYLVQLPSVAELKLELVKANDPAMLIAEYLKDKQTEENDSLNVDLFLNGGPGWRFAFVPAPSIDELYASIPTVNAALAAEAARKARIASGAADRAKCQSVLDLIAGYNRERALTIPQITQMQQTFAQAESLLRASRPDFAKQAIEAIVPDGVLVTEEMKAEALALLAGY